MTFPQIYILIVMVIPLTLVFLNRLREDIAALSMAALLGLAQFLGMGVLGPANTPDAAGKALSGFATPEVITLMSLFIITSCLEKYGVTRWIANKLLSLGGNSEFHLIGLFSLAAATLSLFMNTLAAGSLLLPSAMDASRRTGVKPSKLLIPIAYGTMLGGAATYLTTANIVVSGLLRFADPPQAPLKILDFTPTGGIVAIAGLLFITLFGKKLLPEHESTVIQMGHSADELINAYQLHERMWEAEVSPESSFVNKPLRDTQIGETLGMSILGIRRGKYIIPAEDINMTIHLGDILLIIGREERALQLQQAGLEIHRSDKNGSFGARNTHLAEIIIPPRSSAVGKTLRELEFRTRFGYTAIALERKRRSYRTDLGSFKLETGDSLLLLGSPKNFTYFKNQEDYIVVETAVNGDGLNKPRVFLTAGIALVALVSTILGFPIELAMLSAAVMILLTRLMKPDEAYQSIKWRSIFLIAGTISISSAMVQTNFANLIGNAVVNIVEPLGPMGLIAGAYLLSASLTQVIGGQISPLVVAPITISAAIHLGVNPQAVAVVTAIAGSISFITPLSHPVNMIMIGPGNYTFADFFKSGWLLTIICFIALMFAVPLIWNL